MLKKKVLSFAVLAMMAFTLVGGLAVATPAGAAEPKDTSVSQILDSNPFRGVATKSYEADASGQPTGNSIEDYVVLIINTLLGFLGIIFLILIIYAGFLWMTAGGNDEQVGKAKKILINSIIGVVIIVAAYAISYFVLSALTKP